MADSLSNILTMRNLYILTLLALCMFISCSSNDPATYQLRVTATPEDAGTVTPVQGEFEENRDIEISATPNEHWVFDRWVGDYEGTANPVVITMDSDKEIAAQFVKREYPLEITKVGDGVVNERIVQTKTTDYEQGTLVELTAVPDEGWEFDRWEGDLQGSENPETILIEGVTEVTAVFTRIEFPLTITIVGEGQVFDQDSVNVETVFYESDAEVTLTASPSQNWGFVEWGGDLDGAENPQTIIMDGPKEVTATFERVFTFTTFVTPQEGGQITPEAGVFPRDTTFDVEAIPNEGWGFDRWEGDFTGSINPFSLTMNGNKTVVAHFERLAFSLNDNTRGDGEILISLVSGTETSDGYLFESEVQLIAVPATDWVFVGWEGDVTGTENQITVTMDSDKTITAVFTNLTAGTGTEEDPYQISTVEQLQEVANYPDASFIQMNNIDASETSGWNNGSGFDPIGDEFEPFKGNFDGNGFEISGLFINRPSSDHIGLFGNVEDAVITDVSLQDISINGDDFVGGLAGIINNTEITGAFASGTVNGDQYVGGLVGQNLGAILNSYSLVEVTGNEDTGGLVGRNASEIFRSFAQGSVSGVESTGGLVGFNRGSIEESFSTGSVNGTSNAGGFVGLNNATGEIYTSYSHGNVTADSEAGGFVGVNLSSGIIDETFATGTVTAGSSAGGLAGVNSGTYTGSYWDTESSGLNDAVGDGSAIGTAGLSTAQMTGADAVTNMSDFDWIETWKINPGSYPILQWQ